jgi:hypothetical protein
LIENFRKELRVTQRCSEEQLKVAVVFHFSFVDFHHMLVTAHGGTTLQDRLQARIEAFTNFLYGITTQLILIIAICGYNLLTINEFS